MNITSVLKIPTALKIIAAINIFVALDVMLFWLGFFTEVLFPISDLKPLINNFEGYYAWEKCFFIPDTLTAIVAIWSSINILKVKSLSKNMILLSACSGAWVFLGVLDFTYAINNGMYTLGHWYSYILLEIGMGLPIIGISSLWILIKSMGNMKRIESTYEY